MNETGEYFDYNKTSLLRQLHPELSELSQLLILKVAPSIGICIATPFWLFMLRKDKFPFNKFKNSWNFLSKLTINFLLILNETFYCFLNIIYSNQYDYYTLVSKIIGSTFMIIGFVSIYKN